MSFAPGNRQAIPMIAMGSLVDLGIVIEFW